jgi:hypothetical protein
MSAQAIAGGDIIKVHKTHAFNAGAAIAWTLPETGAGLIMICCVDKDASDALATGAVEETGGNFAFTITTSSTHDSYLYVYGMTIKAGSGASQSSADINIISGSNTGGQAFINCIIWENSSNTNAQITIGATSNSVSQKLRFNSTVFRMLNAGQGLSIQGCEAEFINCRVDSTDATPNAIFLPTTNSKGQVISRGCDWNNGSAVLDQSTAGNMRFLFTNCVFGTPVAGTHPGRGGQSSEFRMCAPVDGTNGADILAYYFESAWGVVEDDQTVYFASGASTGEQDDGTDTPYSLKMTPSSKVSRAEPLYTPWINRMVSTTGAKTITMKVAHTESAVLKENEIWMEVEYMGEPGLTGTQRTANSPHSQTELDDDATLAASSLNLDVLATGDDRTDTAEAVTGITGEKTHTLTASVTCDEAGPIRCRIGLAKDTTNPVYVNAKIGIA